MWKKGIKKNNSKLEGIIADEAEDTPVEMIGRAELSVEEGIEGIEDKYCGIGRGRIKG